MLFRAAAKPSDRFANAVLVAQAAKRAAVDVMPLSPSNVIQRSASDEG
jgi:hypothetical protein